MEFWLIVYSQRTFFYGDNVDGERWNGFETRTIIPDYVDFLQDFLPKSNSDFFNQIDDTQLDFFTGTNADLSHSFTGVVGLAAGVLFDENGDLSANSGYFNDYKAIVIKCPILRARSH